MVDHWPVSSVLSEVEQHIIKEHREGKLMYLSDAEKEMVQLLRHEREVIVNEQNEKSPNQRAVEDIAWLKKFVDHNYPKENYDNVVNFVCGLLENNSTGIVDLEVAVNSLVFHSHKAAVDGGWWNDPVTGEDLHGKRNIGELLMLIVSEIAEGMEGHRKDKMDDKLPHHKMLTVELVDALFRIGDLAGSAELPVGKAAKEKREYNLSREDHKHEQRIKAGGKRF